MTEAEIREHQLRLIALQIEEQELKVLAAKEALRREQLMTAEMQKHCEQPFPPLRGL